jgi:hypothetical protein
MCPVLCSVAAPAAAWLVALVGGPSVACAGQAVLPSQVPAAPAAAATAPAAPEPDYFPCGCWNYTGAEECPRWWHRDVRYRPLFWDRPAPLVAPRAAGGGVRHIGRFYSASETVDSVLERQRQQQREFNRRFGRTSRAGTPPTFPWID